MKKSTTVLLFLLFGCSVAFSQSYTISTIAGGDTIAGYNGDGILAINAELNSPSKVAIDASGNIYIADYRNNRIREINTSNIISTVAGNGTLGFTGDGGQATNAELGLPNGVFLDSLGNIYIADENEDNVRKVTITSGIITTIAGSGVSGFSGDGGQATNATLHLPTCGAVDSYGNVYIADYLNNRIRQVNTLGVINTIAGDGILGFAGDGGPATAAELEYPSAVCINATGMYISDNGNNRVRMITGGAINTVAGGGSTYPGDGGPATNANISVYDVAVDDSGNLYIADLDYNRIRKVNTKGIISTIAGNGNGGFSGDSGLATAAELNYPTGICLDKAGDIYIADYNNNCIRKLTPVILTGINELPVSNSVTIFPNPSTGIFNFQVQGIRVKEQIEIYNLLGEKIYSQQFLIPIAIGTNSQFSINLSSQPWGTYLYRITNQDGSLSTTGKLVKE